MVSGGRVLSQGIEGEAHWQFDCRPTAGEHQDGLKVQPAEFRKIAFGLDDIFAHNDLFRSMNCS